MSRSRRKLIGQRERMMQRQNGRCFFCDVIMLPPGTKVGKSLHPESATFEHWHDRLDDERGRHRGKIINVASCWTCNNKRNAERQREIPKHVLHVQSKRHPSKQ